MEFRDSDDERRFRQEVRYWLRANRPTAPRPHDSDIQGQIAYDRE